MWRCRQCEEECEDGFEACWSCGTGRDGAPAEASFVADRVEEDLEVMSLNAQFAGNDRHNSLVPRYADAYLVARTTTGFGSTIKVLGVVVGGLVAILGLILGTELGGVAAIAGIISGIITALPIYILGILISAQGQILKATVDTAVNTSPLLTKDEMRKMMSLDWAEQSVPQANPPFPVAHVGDGGKFCPGCGASLDQHDRFCNACGRTVTE